jgi:hypothetical protein
MVGSPWPSRRINPAEEEPTPPNSSSFEGITLHSTFGPRVRRSPVSTDKRSAAILRSLAKIFSAHGVHGMPSESPTCVRTGGDSADARIKYISPGKSLFSQQNRLLESKISVSKPTNLAKPLLCLRSCPRSSRAFRPEPRGVGHQPSLIRGYIRPS